MHLADRLGIPEPASLGLEYLESQAFELKPSVNAIRILEVSPFATPSCADAAPALKRPTKATP